MVIVVYSTKGFGRHCPRGYKQSSSNGLEPEQAIHEHTHTKIATPPDDRQKVTTMRRVALPLQGLIEGMEIDHDSANGRRTPPPPFSLSESTTTTTKCDCRDKILWNQKYYLLHVVVGAAFFFKLFFTRNLDPKTRQTVGKCRPRVGRSTAPAHPTRPLRRFSTGGWACGSVGGAGTGWLV